MLAALSLGLAPVALARPSPVQEEFTTRPRSFQIYDSLAARAVAESARDHLIAGRWQEGLTDLQRLLEEHRGEVLGATRPTAPGARHPSQGDVHLGASHWAERLLFQLPPEARALYRERHAGRADGALRRALALGDRGSLASVARRWPLTEAGQRSWWALGDLELERGATPEALSAWARGAALLLEDPGLAVDGAEGWRQLRERLAAVTPGAPTSPPKSALDAAIARVQFALGVFANNKTLDTSGAGPVAGFPHGDVNTTLIEPQGFGAEGWEQDWRVPGRSVGNPFGEAGAHMRIFGARDANTIYVNTSRSVHALGAFSGEPVWSFDPERLGWADVPQGAKRSQRTNGATNLAEFAGALDLADHIVVPAVGSGVVVADLHLPLTYEKRDQFQQIEIIEVLPERRLIALDARTGETLWNTFPPADWDGDGGTFAERMTVVGPPTIIGTRVLVPVARQRGRIELHAACFDLSTGALLWSTPVVTGQVPLNMFGRQVREFSAPPLVVVGATVVVQSNLGVIAALDLFTGDTQWETVYEQIAIQPPSYFQPGALYARWRNAPPVMVGNTVVSTPVDSEALIGIDLGTGALRWSVSHAALLGRRPSRNMATEVLLAADAERVYIYIDGREVVALRAAEGLELGPPTRVAWRRDHPPWRNTDMAHPALDERYVYLPGPSFLTIAERETGRVVREIPGDLGSGNLLVSQGALVAVSAENVSAAFEWRGMLLRAEAAVAAAPQDARPVAELARLYLVRAEGLVDTGDAAEAARLFRTAREVLDAAPRDTDQGPAALHEPRFRALIGEARLARRALDPAAAEERLVAALEVAVDAPNMRQALLALQAIQRQRLATGADPTRARDYEATLARLALEHGDTELMVSFQPALEWSPDGGAGASREDTSANPWIGALVPDEARALGARREAERNDRRAPPDGAGDAPGARARTTVALWVQLEMLAEEHRRGDEAAEAARLFGLLAHFGSAPLPGGGGVDVRVWARGHLARLRARVPADVFAPFEAEAAALLAEVRASHDRGELARVARNYPGTRAAGLANDLRLDLAVETGEVDEVARIVLDPLPPDSTIETLGEREVRLVLRLAATLGARGNLTLRAALVSRLAATHPDVIVDLEPHRGMALGTLATQWRIAAETPPLEAPRYTQSVIPRQALEGDYAFVGAAPDSEGGELAVFLSSSGLVALRPGTRTGIEWNTPLVSGLDWYERTDRSTLRAGLVHVAARDRIVTVAVKDGAEVWTWPVGAGRLLLKVVHSDGVLLARSTPAFGDGSELLVALDTASGVELWRRMIPPGARPVVGSGRLVLALEGGDHAEVIDLFLGGRSRTLDARARGNVPGGEGWISDGLYVLPQFLRDNDPLHNHIEAFDLDSGARVWRIDLEAHRGAPHTLQTVFEHRSSDGETRRLCVLRNSDDRSTMRTVHVLNERLGALDRGALTELRNRSQFVDQPGRSVMFGVVKLESPLVFIQTPDDATRGPGSLRAVDVRLGSLWEIVLPPTRSPDEQQRLFAPTVAQSVVVVPTLSISRGRNGAETVWELTFLDRRTGDTLERRPMPYARWVQAVGVGSTLFLVGDARLDRME